MQPEERPVEEAHEAPAATQQPAPNLQDSEYYVNRELSWLEFNRRVLEEALDERKPLLERVKFLSIFSSNLDEFFMVRVSGLRRQLAAGTLKAPPDGMSPTEQLAAIWERLRPMLELKEDCWRDDLQPALWEEGVRVLAYEQLKSKQRKLLRQHFEAEIFPALTPLAFDPGHPFPHISNLSINLAVVINEPGIGERFARLKVPQILNRLLQVPREEKAGSVARLGLAASRKSTNYVWLEEVVAANLDLLFPGLDVVSAYPFRVTRDADMEIEEDEAADLLTAMQEVVDQRHFGSAIRLEVDARMPEATRDILARNLGLAPYQVYAIEGPLGLADLMELVRIDKPQLKDAPFLPFIPALMTTDESIFAALRRRDILLHHPYESFNPVVDFVRTAAEDPRVVAIKQTLYRVGPDSPIVRALRDARENGKQVSAMVELKARFDEQTNIGWARALERAGVHVVYGVIGLKTHAKMCLVVRNERKGLNRYVHLGTGNYNPDTARVYTDLGLLTSDPEITADVSDVFNAITGYSRKQKFRKLLVSPRGMREGLLERIQREIDAHRQEGGGRLGFKCNALVDPAIIRALYRASQAGVRVDLLVRGICCLRPGLPGVSENIRVISIVGRFLEHARIYYFHNGGDEEILIGSADLMPRNLDGRVEFLVPLEDEGLRTAVRDGILFLQLDDNVQAREMRPDGSYDRVEPGPGQPEIDSQATLLEETSSWNLPVE